MASPAVWPDAGIGQDRGRSASPEELWQDYPLTQDERTGGGRAPAGEASNDMPSQPPGGGSDDEGESNMLVVVGLLVVPLVALLSVSVVLARRPREASVSPDAPPAAPRERSPSAPTSADLGTSPWTAEIQWRSDKGVSRFEVVASPPGGQDGVPLLESRRLDWPPTSEAAVESLVDAVAELERSLLAAGWQESDPGATWYARRFVWPRTDRAPEPALQTAQAARGA